MEMLDILEKALHQKASDIHILPKLPPMVRVSGTLRPIDGYEPLTAEQTKNLVYSILYEEQKQAFEKALELDCSFDVPNLSRFRVNVLVNKDGVAAVLRIIPSVIPTPEDLDLPSAVVDLTQLPRGLVLVTGPTGCGKSTTLACLIELINMHTEKHILTFEDPIEYAYDMKKCVINQREIGIHSRTFQAALRHAMRQDPDVILIGEMRDLETIAIALTLAETGHIVFATLHTTDAPQTIDRIIDIFPPYQQTQIRMQLSVTLQAVVCQQLLPRADGQGRIAAREIMLRTPAIANLIRESKTHQIYSAIEMGTQFGMISLDKSLATLVQRGKISKDAAMVKANDPKTLESLLRSGTVTADVPRKNGPFRF